MFQIDSGCLRALDTGTKLPEALCCVCLNMMHWCCEAEPVGSSMAHLIGMMLPTSLSLLR